MSCRIERTRAASVRYRWWGYRCLQQSVSVGTQPIRQVLFAEVIEKHLDDEIGFFQTFI